MEQPPHRACEQTKSKQKRFSPQTMQWYNYWMASLSDVRVKKKTSCQKYIDAWLSIMSGRGANSIFFNKKDKDWTPRTLANPPLLTSDNISFLSYPSTPHPSKWTSYVYHPLREKSPNTEFFLARIFPHSD